MPIIDISLFCKCSKRNCDNRVFFDKCKSQEIDLKIKWNENDGKGDQERAVTLQLTDLFSLKLMVNEAIAKVQKDIKAPPFRGAK